MVMKHRIYLNVGPGMWWDNQPYDTGACLKFYIPRVMAMGMRKRMMIASLVWMLMEVNWIWVMWM